MVQREHRRNSLGAVKEKGRDDGCCSVEFLKYVLIIFNVIFWLSGFGFIAIGIWTLIDKHDYVTLLNSDTYVTTTFLLLGTGTLVLIIGFLGCFGAWKEKRSCLIIYATLLLLVFILELAVGILAYLYEASVHEELVQGLNRTMLNNYKIDREKTEAIDLMQQTFKCCGAASFMDWRYSRWLKGSRNISNTAPDSCCKTMSTNCAVRDHPSNIYYQGCVLKLEMYLKEHLIIVGAVGIGICSLQIFGIIFACCLARKIRELDNRQRALAWIG